VEGLAFGDRRSVMIFLLFLALALFVLGFFTVKILWWVAAAIAVVWILGMLRDRRLAH
jgi:hypothetical protein